MNFDELEDEVRLPAPAKAKAKVKPDSWRLGHRRPWWQWNVLTLFVALFLLVWLRELARLPTTSTWVICLLIIAVWGLGPLPTLEPPPPRPRTPRRHDPFPLGSPPSDRYEAEPSLARFLAVALAIVMFVAVFALGGLVVCALALLGAMFYAAAVRGR
jgi:hypothetical protein